jgi:hypothetical protein
VVGNFNQQTKDKQATQTHRWRRSGAVLQKRSPETLATTEEFNNEISLYSEMRQDDCPSSSKELSQSLRTISNTRAIGGKSVE